MVLYSNNSLRVFASSDDSFQQSDIQTISDSSEETLVIESSEVGKETSEELFTSEIYFESLRSGSEIDSQTMENSSQVGSRGEETSAITEYVKHIDSTQNSFLGLFVAVLIVVGIGLVVRFIWQLLNK